MKKILICCMPVFLSGCLATVPVANPSGNVTITPEMVSECEPLKPFEGKDMADLIEDDAAIRGALKICIEKNHNKAEIIKKLGGVGQ